MMGAEGGARRDGSEDGNGDEGKEIGIEKVAVWRKVVRVLMWTPPNCRWDPEKPPQFSMGMNVLFAFAGACKWLMAFTIRLASML